MKLTDQDKIRVLITLVVFTTVFLFYHFEILKRFELVTYDYRFLIKGSRPADPRIAIIEISDDSIAKIGRWPWARSWHAALIKILDDLGAKAVVFDVIFSEKSDPEEDALLAKAIEESKKVYLAEVIESSSGSGKTKLLASMPEFAAHAKGAGHINLQPDVDGVMRRMPLVKDFYDTKIPQLSLRVALDEYGVDIQDVTVKGNHLVISLKNNDSIRIPLDKNKNFILNWVGRWKDAFLHFSYVDVVGSYAVLKKGGKPPISLDVFKDKICFIGTSAAGLFDIRPTSLEPSYPAVGVNLTILNNLLERKFIRPLSYSQNLAVLVFLMILLFRVMKLKSYFETAILTAAVAVCYVLLAIVLFVHFNIWINIIYSLLLILATYFFITLYNQLSVTIERSRLLKLATRDSLTGLYNIGHFKLLLKAEITTISMRREKTLSIVMSDVDNFKKTNDTYGHVTGDMVLKEVADTIRTTCRALDVAARYGGEEFIVMLPGADVDIAFKIAEKIRKLVNQKVFTHEKGDFSTSISMGVTQVSPDEKNIEVIVGRADKALYEAKQSGKNKVVIASDSPKVSTSPS